MEINGIEYEQIPQPKASGNTRMSAYMSAMLMIYGNGMFDMSHKKTKTSPTDNIIGEFELIQLKKSNLSRSEREYVVRQFNRYFRVKQMKTIREELPKKHKLITLHLNDGSKVECRAYEGGSGVYSIETEDFEDKRYWCEGELSKWNSLNDIIDCYWEYAR